MGSSTGVPLSDTTEVGLRDRAIEMDSVSLHSSAAGRGGITGGAAGITVDGPGNSEGDSVADAGASVLDLSGRPDALWCAIFPNSTRPALCEEPCGYSWADAELLWRHRFSEDKCHVFCVGSAVVDPCRYLPAAAR